MRKASLLLLLLCASCRLPDSAGPYVESVYPPGSGHDFVGTVGVEAQWGPMLLGVGVLHPGNGAEEILFRFGYQFRF